MAKKRLKIALIGCGGNMQHAHLPRIREDGAVDLVAVADPSEEAAKSLMERWGTEISCHRDYQEMLGAHLLDAVMISSPHALHYEQVDATLERNLNVLVEKPLTISSGFSTSTFRFRSRVASTCS